MEADKAIVADDPPPPDLTVYEKHFIFPYTNYTKKEMKDFKVLNVISACRKSTQ